MLTKVDGKSRKRWRSATGAFAIMALVASGALAAGDSTGGPPVHTKQVQEMLNKQFLRAHSDASGKPRPDLWRKGVEDQKQMQVAPYIGWHPSSSIEKSGSTNKN